MYIWLLLIYHPLVRGEDIWGVPSDLVSLLPQLKSEDFGKYSQCESARGTNLWSGICVSPSYEVPMPFCGEYVNYTTCVPPRNPTWPSWNLTAKDAVIKKYYNQIVEDRLRRESLSLANNGTSNEYLEIRFSGYPDCVANFKKIVCFYNFPSCNPDVPLKETITFPVCSERCTDYFKSCQFGANIVSEMCDTIGSVWPLDRADVSYASDWIMNGTNGSSGSSLNTSVFSLKLQSANVSGSSCTGKSAAQTLTLSILGLAVLLI